MTKGQPRDPEKWDLVSKLTPEERAKKEFQMNCISPDDGKYAEASEALAKYLTPRAEWQGCINVQKALLETRVEFEKATQEDLDALNKAIPQVRELNISLLEEDERLKHDQLAVLAELGLHMPEEVEAVLHPGTTSYDILDTARNYLFKKAWNEVIKPEIATGIEKLCFISERANSLHVGRTHLQNTSPVLFEQTFSIFAARIADRFEMCDLYFENLRGKISGIVGTGASIDMVIGEGKSIEFEKKVLEKLGLKPDYTATQIVQKERLADVGNGLVTLNHVLGDFANDIRILYSSAIKEVTSRDNKERLGGSSADAGKDNPIQFENIAGKGAVVESGMRILYEMIRSDLERDLRGSVQARYQPQPMMVEVYEMFRRLNKTLNKLSINDDKVFENLLPVKKSPSEAMTAILRGEAGWTHSQYGPGHDFVKEMAKIAQKNGRPLLQVAREDPEFEEIYHNLSETKQRILGGELELYTGSSAQRAKINRDYARSVIKKYKN